MEVLSRGRPAAPGAKTVGIMQPYYFPYLGYFSHISQCDAFILHDIVKYTKRGWINRNRILTQSGISTFTLSLDKAPDDFKISQRSVSESYEWESQFRILEGAYRKAPYWFELRGILPDLLGVGHRGLFVHLFQQVSKLCDLLEIRTPLARSSQFSPLDDLTGQDLVIGICEKFGARSYLNPAGGENLYSQQDFDTHGLVLSFIEHVPRPYLQRVATQSEGASPEFVERLSVLDSLAELGLEETKIRLRTDFNITAPRRPGS